MNCISIQMRSQTATKFGGVQFLNCSLKTFSKRKSKKSKPKIRLHTFLKSKLNRLCVKILLKNFYHNEKQTIESYPFLFSISIKTLYHLQFNTSIAAKI